MSVLSVIAPGWAGRPHYSSPSLEPLLAVIKPPVFVDSKMSEFGQLAMFVTDDRVSGQVGLHLVILS